MIRFNKPYITGNEEKYIAEVIRSAVLAGNGSFTKKCQRFFEERYHFKKCLLTTSCTDALEMAAILCEIQPGDEVIMPSYTFVSTANAFILRGAQIRFVDSRTDHPGMDENKIEELITEKTKAIIVVHYAGVAVDMDKIMDIAHRKGLFVIEDAAQAIDNYYHGKNGKQPLGGIGHVSAFSFHETKNICSGEGGMLVVNDERFIDRAEIIWEKGTNRSAFFRGEVDKYGWVDIGSSFLPSELNAAFLWAQLEKLDEIQELRKSLWNTYYDQLKDWADKGDVCLPHIPSYSDNNAHMFYLVCKNQEERINILEALNKHEIKAVFHYLSLHDSSFYRRRHDGRALPSSDKYSECLFRLPLFPDLSETEVSKILNTIKSYNTQVLQNY